jgi:modulator of FtsH protease HflK
MQQIYSNVTKVLVESRQGSSLLYLPLEKILQMGNSGGSVAAPVAASGAVQVVPPTGNVSNNDARSRDAARTRERDSR